jgi:hypothetical protein
MSSRREQKEALRAERLAREQQAAAAERRKRLVGYGAGGLLALAAVVAIVVVLASGGDGGSEAAGGGASGEFPAGSAPPVETTDLEEAVDAAGCELEENPEEGNTHVEESVTYEANPPTSGDHDPIPAEDGAYTDAPPKENLVHALEHGRIVIQFAPDAPDSVKGDLKALFDEAPYHAIITPNETDMPYEVAATAWNQVLGCEEMNDQVFDAIRAFREEFLDRGPEFVP